MRAAWLVLAGLLLPITARADDNAAVEALVRAEVKSLVDDKAPDAAFTPDRMIVQPPGTSMKRVANFYGLTASKIVHKLDKIAVTVDHIHHVAWFHAGVTASYDDQDCGDGIENKCKPTVRVNATWRLNGVAIDDHGWKLAAVMWSRAKSDKELLASATHDDGAPSPPTLIGSEPIGHQLAGWITGGLSAHAGAGAIVNGTAPAEYAAGPAVAALVKAWDGLKLVATKIAVQTWSSDAIGYAQIEVAMPTKQHGSSVPMTLGVVLVPVGGGWQWVSLDFAESYNHM